MTASMPEAAPENQVDAQELDRILADIAVNGTLEQRTDLMCRIVIDQIAMTGDIVTCLQWLYEFSANSLAAILDRGDQGALH